MLKGSGALLKLRVFGVSCERVQFVSEPVYERKNEDVTTYVSSCACFILDTENIWVSCYNWISFFPMPKSHTT